MLETMKEILRIDEERQRTGRAPRKGIEREASDIIGMIAAFERVYLPHLR